MKLWLVVIVAVAAVAAATATPQKWLEKHKKSFEECKEEIGLDDEALKKLKDSDAVDGDEKLKCFFKCTLLKNNLITENGEVQFDTVKAEDDDDNPEHKKFLEHLEKCKDMKVDSCDAANDFKKCIMENMKIWKN